MQITYVIVVVFFVTMSFLKMFCGKNLVILVL